MSNYFYAIILFIACAYFIIDDIYLFNKGQYNPYFFAKELDKKRRILNFVISVVGYWSLYTLLFATKPPIFTVLLYSIVSTLCFIICMSILNYLSYVKIKNKKIIYQTLIFDISVIVFWLYMVNLYLRSPNNG